MDAENVPVLCLSSVASGTREKSGMTRPSRPLEQGASFVLLRRFDNKKIDKTELNQIVIDFCFICLIMVFKVEGSEILQPQFTALWAALKKKGS